MNSLWLKDDKQTAICNSMEWDLSTRMMCPGLTPVACQKWLEVPRSTRGLWACLWTVYERQEWGAYQAVTNYSLTQQMLACQACPGFHRDSIKPSRQKHLSRAASFLEQPCALELSSVMNIFSLQHCGCWPHVAPEHLKYGQWYSGTKFFL